MKPKWLTTYLSGFLLLSAISTQTLLPAAASADASATSQLTYSNSGLLVTGGVVIKNGVSYIASSMVSPTGLEIRWDRFGKRAEFIGFEKSFPVRIGSRTGVLDGKMLDIGGIPFLDKDVLYLHG